MAINTAEELLSLIDANRHATSPGIPFPRATFRTQERLHLLWLYAGLSAASTREPTPAGSTVIPLQRYLVRTAQFDQMGETSIEDFRLSIKRGIGGNADDPKIRFRVKRDNRGFSKWIVRSLGLAGDRFSTINIGPLGTAHVWQFEVVCDDDCDVELQGMEAVFRRIGR